MAPLSSRAANVAPICNSAALLPRVLVALTPGPYSFISIPPLTTYIISASLMILVLLLTAVPRMHAALKYVDSFAAAHTLKENEAFINVPTPLGGACTLLSIIAFLTAAIVLIIGYASSNAVVTSALDTSTIQSSPFTSDIVWATIPSAVNLLPSFPKSTSLQIRIFSPVGLNCATQQTLTSWTASDSGWTPGVTSDCGDGRSLLTLTCTSCALSASSILTITLPFTCQSLYVEAIAIDATGEMNMLQLPTTSSAAVGSQLLTAITWTLNPMASIYKDTITGQTARGFRLLSGSVSPSYSASNAALLSPLAASVVLTVNLPLQSTFAVTTLTQLQTIAQLLTNIIGLLGIMGAFKILFQMAENQGHKPWLRHLIKRGPQPLTAEPIVGVKVTARDENALTVIENPVGRRNSREWMDHVEADGEVWYSNSITGESSWVLPEGTTLVRRHAVAALAVKEDAVVNNNEDARGHVRVA